MTTTEQSSFTNVLFLVSTEAGEEIDTEMTEEIGAEEGHGEHHENSFFLPGDVKEFYWATAAFLVLMGLIIWKGGGAIKRMIDGRTNRIEAELNDAKADRDAAEAALNASTSDLPDLGQEEARIRREAEETATRLKADLIAKAEAEADSIRQRGTTDVANRKRQARAEMVASVSESTRRSAEAVVRETMDNEAQIDLIEQYINEVGRTS